MAFQRRGYRPSVSIEYSLDQLAGSIRLAADPASGPGRYVTFDALDSGMKRVLIGRILRLHAVATRATKLRSLHVLDGPIGDLSPDDDVEHGHYANKPGDAPQGSFAIEAWFCQPLAYLALAEEDSDWDQNQSGKEDGREYEENDDSNVGIINVPADLQWQDEKPRNDSGCKKRDPDQANPVPSQQKPRRPFRCAIHSRAICENPRE